MKRTKKCVYSPEILENLDPSKPRVSFKGISYSILDEGSQFWLKPDTRQDCIPQADLCVDESLLILVWYRFPIMGTPILHEVTFSETAVKIIKAFETSRNINLSMNKAQFYDPYELCYLIKYVFYCRHIHVTFSEVTAMSCLTENLVQLWLNSQYEIVLIERESHHKLNEWNSETYTSTMGKSNFSMANP